MGLVVRRHGQQCYWIAAIFRSRRRAWPLGQPGIAGGGFCQSAAAEPVCQPDQHCFGLPNLVGGWNAWTLRGTPSVGGLRSGLLVGGRKFRLVVANGDDAACFAVRALRGLGRVATTRCAQYFVGGSVGLLAGDVRIAFAGGT